MPKRLLFISNGHGEDSIAAEIVRRLPRASRSMPIPLSATDAPTTASARSSARAPPPQRRLTACAARCCATRSPASASARASASCAAWPRPMMPSSSSAICIGIVMCWFERHPRPASISTSTSPATTTAISGVERWLIGRTCDLVFNRDARLAAQLTAAGVDARFAGNVMMDTLVTGAFDAAARRRHPRAIAILPGSRDTMRENFALQLEALRPVPSICRNRSVHRARSPRRRRRTCRGRPASPWRRRHCSATATSPSTSAPVRWAPCSSASRHRAGAGRHRHLQALGLGSPVVTFLTAGTTTAPRCPTNAALFGDSRLVVDRDPAALAAAMARLLPTTPIARAAAPSAASASARPAPSTRHHCGTVALELAVGHGEGLGQHPVEALAEIGRIGLVAHSRRRSCRTGPRRQRRWSRTGS